MNIKIRKMQTSAGGPIFTPEQMAAMERIVRLESSPSFLVKGTNTNSNRTVGTTARKAGVEATRTRQRRKRVEDSKPIGEMHTPVSVATRQDPVTKEVVVTKWGDAGSNSSGAMSGRDPMLGTIFDWTVGAKGIDALGKTTLWNVAKHAPTTQLGNWGRNYFVNLTFKLGLRKPILFGVGETLLPLVRTRIGDVEINNPELYYHQADAGKAKNFISTGRMRTPLEEYWLAKLEAGEHIPLRLRAGVEPGYPQDPGSAMFAQGNLWYGLTPNKPDLLVTAREMPIANKNASVMSDKASLRALEEQGSRRVTNDNFYTQGPHNRQNTAAYIWKPGYGYKLVVEEPSTSLVFFERKPSRISLAERLGISKGDRNLPFKQKLPTEHIQGEEAVKMFKEYGGTPIPEGSINGEQLRKYVAEARERYGLVGNNNVTDEEIALALYKHSKELGGNTAAVNALGEPLLLFRGDTRRYTQLKERISPEELAKKSGTMDNSLGNLFLGEFPDSWRGVDRYIGTWRNFNGSPKLVGSGTGSKVVWDGKTASEIEGYPYLGPLAGGGYKLYSQPHRYGNIDVYKLPASMMESGVNDLNAFIVRTPQMRNASSEISVLNDDWMLQGAKDSHFMSKNYKYNPKTYSMENVKTGESLGEITTESAPESRAAMGDHYKELLKEAKQKQLGLLKSEANAPLRDEHSLYSYFALPNFNIQGAKHLLPYDLRIPRNWKDKNIYRGLIPLTTGYTLYDLFNQPQLQYLKQGGQMNILLFLKNGSGIHIKKKNRGKFTDYCGGKVTNECIRKAKASGNPTLVKRATFADNARHFKHKEGGKAFVEGVNVLDSNPNMYRKKKIRKGQEGTKLQLIGQWISNNKDSISGIISGVSSLVGSGNTYNKKKDALDALRKAFENSYADLMLDNIDLGLYATQLKQMNPDSNYSSIDMGYWKNLLRQLAANKAKAYSNLWYLTQLNLLGNEQQLNLYAAAKAISDGVVSMMSNKNKV